MFKFLLTKNKGKQKMEDKKIECVKDLRELIYEEINRIKKGEFDYKKTNALSRACQQVFVSYKLQMTAMKMTGKKVEVSKLSGLLD